ncbi:asparagine synthase (glutamine-hydrolyzing) [Saccharothrix yanglingensis]|uniref:asparagine synthase (glutamine-hydrolyzing) n=1 Tax=Saccharothrix yanglingensis TaxID=659496 RepID=A0ABU0X3G7_9PSEU|nr:asparagine synthase (glutamine-hydrolyzing) [Saccharothrix yanglingensis]MDQ2586680.1 asparagine synthase (glutamine-hydrolyzing) [Saccharothrix yanglingensis]
MCGIAGFMTCERLAPDAPRVLDRMLAVLGHRGPDGPGSGARPAAGLAMGHTRLAINDLGSGGAQPMTAPDGSVVATVAGELYGFRRMRAELTARGERFATKSDSELVLPLYRRHGLDFVRHLRGEFAIALFDAERDRLVLARDRFGVRPLFFHVGSAVFGWASEAKALLEHPAVPRRLSATAAVNQLVQVMVPGSTAFEGVESLRPGHLLVVDRDGDRLRVRAHRYWDLEFPHEGGWGDEEPEAHVDAVRDAVTDALAVRVEADVPVGLYLSGGMDSGALLGMTAALAQKPPEAFTIAFSDPAYDESGIAAKVAEHAGVGLAVRHVDDDELYDEHYVRAVWHSERTFYNTLGVAKMQLSGMVAARGVRAVVSGEGADELFAGYPAFALDHVSPDLNRADDLFVGAILPATAQRHPGFERVVGFTPGWVQPWVSTWRLVRPLLADGLLAALGDYDPLEAVAQALDPAALEHRGRLDRAQYTWAKTMLDGQILSWGGDRVDMANAVETRPVLLDHLVAETAVRVPPALRIRNGTEKWVLREALRHAMPEFLYERRKFAFMAPPAHRSEARAHGRARLVGKYLTRDRIADVGICDPDRTLRFLAELPADNATANEHDKVHNHLLGLHILHDLYVR